MDGQYHPQPGTRSGNRFDRQEPHVAVPAFTLPDQGGRPWSLAEHLDAGVVIVTLRGDW
jgi:hypothetical protein